MGMVLAAVREDRMPGGRNSGAVYNLYKVKYKKHKRRDTTEKALKLHRLNFPTCKLEMPDVIPGYPGENLPSSDSAYESSTDCGTDTTSNRSEKSSSSYSQYHPCYHPYHYKNVTTTSASSYAGSVSEHSLVIKSHSAYQSPVASTVTSSASSSLHLTTVHSGHPNSFDQRIFTYQDGPSGLKIPSPPGQRQGHGNSTMLESKVSPPTTSGSQSSHYHNNISFDEPSHPQTTMSSYKPPEKYPIDVSHCSPDKLYPQHIHQDRETRPPQLHDSQRTHTQHQHFTSMKAEQACATQPHYQSQKGSTAKGDNRERSDTSGHHQFYTDSSLYVKQEIDSHEDFKQSQSCSNYDDADNYITKYHSTSTLAATPKAQTNGLTEVAHDQNCSSLTRRLQAQTSHFSPSSSHTFKLPPTLQHNKGNKGKPSESFKNMAHPVSTSSMPYYASTTSLISDLAKNDSLLTIAEDYQIDKFTGSEETVAQALCQVGDSIVMRFVQWMKQLPFYREIPKELQTKILMSKWHELLLLIMVAYGPVTKHPKKSDRKPTFSELYDGNIQRMQEYLDKSFNKFFTYEQLQGEIGGLMDKVTAIMAYFWDLGITRKELLCLKVILLLNHESVKKDPKLNHISNCYKQALQQYILERFPSEANRLGDLLGQFPDLQAASAQLLSSKMIYIPFLLNA
ncbi:unnamed protein product [Lymnaea stagnalis]|uniref:NR LBD domain-containing protein n=1 Tax=Lymnaea stagnalis TaxID=6523 RepID=A0AAV2IEZ9_LYMST